LTLLLSGLATTRNASSAVRASGWDDVGPEKLVGPCAATGFASHATAIRARQPKTRSTASHLRSPLAQEKRRNPRATASTAKPAHNRVQVPGSGTACTRRYPEPPPPGASVGVMVME